MLDIASREQQYLLSNRSYADKTTIETNGYALPAEVSVSYDYSIAISTATVPAFTITFTAKAAQTADGDLTLNHTGAKAPADKW